MLLSHVGRGVVDEADQRLGGFPAGGVASVGRDRGGYQDLHLGAFGEMDRLLGPKDAVFVNGLDCHWLTFTPHFTATGPHGLRIAWMVRKTQFVTWNGRDVPPEFHELPAGLDVVEPIEDEAPTLSPAEDAGIEAALESYRQGHVVDAKRAREIIDAALGRTRPSPSSLWPRRHASER